MARWHVKRRAYSQSLIPQSRPRCASRLVRLEHACGDLRHVSARPVGTIAHARLHHSLRLGLRGAVVANHVPSLVLADGHAALHALLRNAHRHVSADAKRRRRPCGAPAAAPAPRSSPALRPSPCRCTPGGCGGFARGVAVRMEARRRRLGARCAPLLVCLLAAARVGALGAAEIGLLLRSGSPAGAACQRSGPRRRLRCHARGACAPGQSARRARSADQGRMAATR